MQEIVTMLVVLYQYCWHVVIIQRDASLPHRGTGHSRDRLQERLFPAPANHIDTRNNKAAKGSSLRDLRGAQKIGVRLNAHECLSQTEPMWERKITLYR